MVEVIQADRDAAAPYMGFAFQRAKDGKCDQGTLVEAFAAHRIAATSTLQAQCERQRVAEWRFDVPDADSRRARHIVLVTGSKWHSDMPWYREAVGVAATIYEGRQGYKPEDIAEIEQRYDFDAGTGKVVAWMDFIAPDLPQDSHKLEALPTPQRALAPASLDREGDAA